MLCASWLSGAFINVRQRVRDGGGGGDRNATSREPPSQRCSTSAHALNRSYSSVFDGASQFTPIRSLSYVESLPNPEALPPSSGRQRTAIVGPHFASAFTEDSSPFFGVGRRLRSDGDMESTEMPPSRHATPLDAHNHNLQSRRRSLQPGSVGGVYQLCVTPSSGQNPSTLAREQRMPSTEGRLPPPRDIHSNSASSTTLVAADMSPTKHSSRRTLNSGVNVQLGSPLDEPPVPVSTPTASRKMMVAPQPHCRSHPRERYDDPYRDQHVSSHRRLSGGPGGCSGAVVPLYGASESRRQRGDCVGIVQSPTSESPFQFEERSPRGKQNGDMRVAVLEQRVRELEAAVIGGSPALNAAPSFIIPVVGNKTSRMVPSTSGQLVVSTVASTSQQLMAQEIVDKEVEIERLQSHLRKCYSRMENRQTQYDDEVSAFRRESEEAKSQLARVKARLAELEAECGLYREKAAAVEAARNSAIEASMEKIAAQDKEVALLRAELEKSANLKEQLEAAKREREFLELQNEALNTTIDTKDALIRDLEDSMFVSSTETMKMNESCRVNGSGSATPRTDSFSLFDVQSPKFLGDLNNLKELTPTPTGTDTPHVGAIKRSETFHQLGGSRSDVYVSSLMSQLIRRMLATVLECRLLAKCLKDTASKAITGDAPSVNRLLGCTSDSMSESDMEAPTQLVATSMSSSSAERCLRKGADDLAKLEKDLNALREKFIEYYQKKVAEELNQSDACKIQ